MYRMALMGVCCCFEESFSLYAACEFWYGFALSVLYLLFSFVSDIMATAGLIASSVLCFWIPG